MYMFRCFNRKTDNRMSTDSYMKIAISEAYKGIRKNHGGPFGAVIVKDGKIIAKGHNRVVKKNDPTRHGEIDAIRKACRKLRTFDLSGCVLYTTGEPCPMCLCACMWANINKIYYACSLEDNSLIGFRDSNFESVIGNRDLMNGYLIPVDKKDALKLFDDYNNLVGKTSY